jgi:hypothetical protein
VADIVKRVKCELADSFDKKTEDSRFLWMQDWTVKTDLTLQINDQAGVSPSASYTNYAKNAFNYGAGTQSLTANTIGFVQQFFTLAAGANYSEQAVRTEVVSFSLALKELKVWREQLRRLEERADFPPELRVCNPRGRLELAGDLGLREWVDSALYPVSNADLFAGNHPAPGVAPAKAPPNPIAPPKAPTLGQVVAPIPKLLTRAEIQKLLDEITPATNAAKDDTSQIAKSATAAKASAQQLSDALATMKKTQSVYRSVATDEIKRKISKYLADLQLLHRYAATDLNNINDSTEDADKKIKEIVKLYGSFIDQFNTETYDDHGLQQSHENYQADHDTILRDKPQVDMDQGNVKRAADHLQEMQSLAVQISVRPDPPEDSLLHSVQFVVAYGANISPSWTLIAFKGPGLSGSLVGAQGTRTHILNIALGPRATPDATSEQARLINNQTILLSHE